MALLYFDGFEWSTPIDWTGSLDYSAVSPRSGAGSIWDPDNGVKTYPIAASTTTFIIGAALKSPANQEIYRIYEGGVLHIVFKVDATGHVIIQRYATVLATSEGTWDWNNWHYVEVKVTVHDTAGAFEVRVDGVTAISGTDVDTRYGGTTGICNILQLRGSACYHDDLYVCDSSGATCNDFLGPVRVLQLLPNAAGDDTDFTPSTGSNYQNVDESPTPDGDTTYNASATSGHRDLYNLSALTAQMAAGTVYGVRVKASMRKDDTPTVEAKIALKSGSTIAYGAAKALAEAYDEYEAFWELNPDDAAAFSFADMDALQAGVEVV